MSRTLGLQAFSFWVVLSTPNTVVPDRNECAPNLSLSHSIELSEICVQPPYLVHFPGYGVTSADGVYPLLQTHSVYSCTSVVIYNHSTKLGLLAHFTPGEQPDTFREVSGQYPRDSYLEYFHERYFANDAPSDISVLLIRGIATPQKDYVQMQNSVLQHFAGAAFYFDDTPSDCTRRDIQLDTRTGQTIIEEKFIAYEKGIEPTCISFLLNDILSNRDTFTDPDKMREHMRNMLTEWDYKTVKRIEWELGE